MPWAPAGLGQKTSRGAICRPGDRTYGTLQYVLMSLACCFCLSVLYCTRLLLALQCCSVRPPPNLTGGVGGTRARSLLCRPHQAGSTKQHFRGAQKGQSDPASNSSQAGNSSLYAAARSLLTTRRRRCRRCHRTAAATTAALLLRTLLPPTPYSYYRLLSIRFAHSSAPIMTRGTPLPGLRVQCAARHLREATKECSCPACATQQSACKHTRLQTPPHSSLPRSGRTWQMPLQSTAL